MLVNTSQGGGGGTVPSGTLEAMQAQIDALQAQLNNYQLLSQKDQANGYAALNAQRQLDPARIPSAPRWTNARTLTLAGDATGSVALDGSANATLTVDVPGLDSLQGGGAGAIALASFNPANSPISIFFSNGISSIDYLGAGHYRINFSSEISGNYVVVGIAQYKYFQDPFYPVVGCDEKTPTNTTITIYSPHTGAFVNPQRVEIALLT